MRKQIVTVALAGSLGLAGAALFLPGVATAQTASPSPGAAVTDRLTAIKDALKGLVSDKTLTQAQADRVASTLAEELPRGGHHGRGAGGPARGGAHLDPAAVAKAAGATVAELKASREAGQTLAQLAQSKGVSKGDLVSALVAAGKAELAEQVTAGRLTQAQADARVAGLQERVTEMVDRVGPGPRGGRHHDEDGDEDGDGDTGAAPSGTAGTTPGGTAGA